MKKILLPFASLFLIYQFSKLLMILKMSKAGDFHWISDFTFAFFITLFGTGIFAFVGFAYPTSKLIGSNYYKLKNPERLKKVYTNLGVKHFKHLLLLFFWGTEKNRKKYFNGTKAGLKNFVYQTHQSEFGHLGALVLLAVTSVFVAWNGYLEMSLIITIINFIGNFYPIILQRYHRIRIEKLILV